MAVPLWASGSSLENRLRLWCLGAQMSPEEQQWEQGASRAGGHAAKGSQPWLSGSQPLLPPPLAQSPTVNPSSKSTGHDAGGGETTYP